jgi:hypothetical protein
MLKKAGSKQALLTQTNKRTLASVKKEMKQPRKAQSVREEEITHLHVKLQQRPTS